MSNLTSVDNSADKPCEEPPAKKLKTSKLKTVSDKWDTILCKVDDIPLKYDIAPEYRRLEAHSHRFHNIQRENAKLISSLFNAPVKVDSRWSKYPEQNEQYFQTRCEFYKRNEFLNKIIFDLICTTQAKVETCAEHAESWRRHRRQIIEKAEMPFLLFPPNPEPLIEDPTYRPPEGVKRPRVHMTLQTCDGNTLGVLRIELFTDLAPNTCKLFQELLAGDGVGYSYVGTKFFSKVPGMYWAGGDVTHNNGFGCYCQKGRTIPIGAEHYDYRHTMPGLLTMRVTRNNEMCGIFDITFKALPQFDRTRVVFGRVIRPSKVFSKMVNLGSIMCTWPIVSISQTKYKDEHGEWKFGTRNTNIFDPKRSRDKYRKYYAYDNIPHAKRSIYYRSY